MIGIENAEIQHLVQDIWTQFLGDETEVLDSEDEFETLEFDFTVYISLAGPSSYGILLSYPEYLGRKAASSVFGIDEFSVSTEDIVDVLGDLANRVAAKLKAKLPKGTQIGLPMVAEGPYCHVEIPCSEEVFSADFETPDDWFHISIFEVQERITQMRVA